MNSPPISSGPPTQPSNVPEFRDLEIPASPPTRWFVGSYWLTHEQPMCCSPSVNFFRLIGFTKTGLPKFAPLGKTETDECITPTRDPSGRYTGTHFGKVTAKLNPNVKNNNVGDRHAYQTKPIAARKNNGRYTLKSALLYHCPDPERTLEYEWSDYR